MYTTYNNNYFFFIIKQYFSIDRSTTYNWMGFSRFTLIFVGIRHPEEVSFCKPLEPHHLKYNLKDYPNKKREINGSNGKILPADTNTFIANQSPAGSTGSLDQSQPFMCAPVTPRHHTSTPISSPMGTVSFVLLNRLQKVLIEVD